MNNTITIALDSTDLYKIIQNWFINQNFDGDMTTIEFLYNEYQYNPPKSIIINNEDHSTNTLNARIYIDMQNLDKLKIDNQNV